MCDHYDVDLNDGKTKGEYSIVLIALMYLKIVRFWLSEIPTQIDSNESDGSSIRICSWIQVRDKRAQ
jgi:hypothetical protein